MGYHPMNQKDGKGYLAFRNALKYLVVTKGTVILSCKPFAYTLIGKNTNNHCDTCFRKKDSDESHLSRCGKCQLVQYCDRKCQKKGWIDGHRWECSGFKEYGKLAPPFSRLLLRVIIKLQTSSNMSDRISPTASRGFQDLMSHYNEVRADATRMEHIYTSGKVVQSLLKHHELNIPDEHELIRICGRIYVNTFSITDPEFHQIGTGLYLGASVFDHSCEPMACATFESTTIYIRNIIEYPENLPIQKVTISYQDTLRPSTIRIPELRSIYYFDCQCERCSIPSYDTSMSAIFCNNKAQGCTEEIEIRNWINCSCTKCGLPVPEELVSRIEEAEEMVRGKLLDMRYIGYLDVCETCLNVMKSLNFSDTHWLVTSMASQAFDSSIEMSRWEGARKYGTLALKGYRKYLSSCHPLLGIMLLKVAKLSWFLESGEDAKTFITEAKSIIDVTHGPNSYFSLTSLYPLYKEIKTYS